MNSPKILSQERLAELVSFLTNPALVLTISLAIIISRYADSVQQFWRWTGVGVFLLLGPSFVYILYTWYKERKIDIDISQREDRIVPLMITTLGAVFGGYLVQTRLDSPTLLLLSYILVAMLVLLTIVTFVWKISLHSATLTATVSLLVFFRGPEFAWFYLLLIPIAWARLRLRQHTPAQLVAGSLTGVLVTYLAAVLFRG